MSKKENLTYIEFPSSNLAATKAFFEAAFGWSFRDYGPDYASFAEHGINGGFYQADLRADTDVGTALIVLYCENLEETRETVIAAGGSIKRDIFSFPGGRRFHFTEPSGNELAFWSDQGV